jgi:hypothetical protein
MMNNSESIDEGHRESPARCVDPVAAGDSTRQPPRHALNLDTVSSPLWRVALHEASHICTARFQNLEVAGSTLVEGPGYQGLTWSTGSKRALHGKLAYDSDGNDAHDAVAVRVADNVSQFMTGAGEDAAADIYSIVQAHVVDLMAGAAGEMAFLGDAPPMYMTSDVFSANAIAGIICRSPASRASFIEHAYQEALAIITANKPVVIALATALIDHPERTLNSVEIDQCISDTLDCEASRMEAERRARWRMTEQNAAAFAAGLDSRGSQERAGDCRKPG